MMANYSTDYKVDINKYLDDYNKLFYSTYPYLFYSTYPYMDYYVPKCFDGQCKYELNIAGTQRDTIKSFLTDNVLIVKYKNKTANTKVSFKFPKEADLDTVTVKYIDGMLIVSAQPIVPPTREIPLS
jgi:HSP20 family molecular chaperone IbpA